MTDTAPATNAGWGWIEAQMSAKGITRRQLAVTIDVSTQLISQWKNGQRPVSPEKANLIADALELAPSYVWARLGITLPGDVDVVDSDGAGLSTSEAASIAAIEEARDEGDEGPDNEGSGERAS